MLCVKIRGSLFTWPRSPFDIDTYSAPSQSSIITMASYTEEELRLTQMVPEEVTIEAWYMDDSDADQRLPHRLVPNEPCPLEKLAELGVLAYKLDADQHETDPRLAAIRKVRGYTYGDVISIHKDKLPNYEEKIKSFYEEHLHTDEEIRFVLDGSGYFDVRDKEERWIRIWTRKGDLVIMPAGIYHRFTLDEGNYIQAMRLFVGEPVWTPYNRALPNTEEMAERKQYVATIKAH